MKYIAILALLFAFVAPVQACPPALLADYNSFMGSYGYSDFGAYDLPTVTESYSAPFFSGYSSSFGYGSAFAPSFSFSSFPRVFVGRRFFGPSVFVGPRVRVFGGRRFFGGGVRVLVR